MGTTVALLVPYAIPPVLETGSEALHLETLRTERSTADFVVFLMLASGI